MKDFGLVKSGFLLLFVIIFGLCVLPMGWQEQKDPLEREGPVLEHSPRAQSRGGVSAEI